MTTQDHESIGAEPDVPAKDYQRLRIALSEMRKQEGSEATGQFVHQVLEDAADPDIRAIANRLSKKIRGMGKAGALEVLAEVARLLNSV